MLLRTHFARQSSEGGQKFGNASHLIFPSGKILTCKLQMLICFCRGRAYIIALIPRGQATLERLGVHRFSLFDQTRATSGKHTQLCQLQGNPILMQFSLFHLIVQEYPYHPLISTRAWEQLGIQQMANKGKGSF